jgi:hypothetical protein
MCFERTKCVFQKYFNYRAFHVKSGWNVFDSPCEELENAFFKKLIHPILSKKIAIEILRELLHSLAPRCRTGISDMFLKSP